MASQLDPQNQNSDKVFEDLLSACITEIATLLIYTRDKEMKKDTNESFDLKNKTNYKRIGEYLGSKVKILFKCYKCSNEWLVRPNDIMTGRGCPDCASTKYTNEMYTQALRNKGIRYKLKGTYNGTDVKIDHECPDCASVWPVTPHSILNGSGCPTCAGNIKYTTETYAQALLDKGIKYLLTGTYKGNKVKTDHECPKCTNTWSTAPSNILTGRGCPICSSSGFDISKQAYLYFIQIITPHDSFLKVGITNREVSKRFSEIARGTNAIELTVIKTLEGLGSNIRDLEQKILKSFDRYTPCEAFVGYTECLALDLKEEVLKYLN